MVSSNKIVVVVKTASHCCKVNNTRLKLIQLVQNLKRQVAMMHKGTLEPCTNRQQETLCPIHMRTKHNKVEENRSSSNGGNERKGKL
jgi:hypothetical protein